MTSRPFRGVATKGDNSWLAKKLVKTCQYKALQKRLKIKFELINFKTKIEIGCPPTQNFPKGLNKHNKFLIIQKNQGTTTTKTHLWNPTWAVPAPWSVSPGSTVTSMASWPTMSWILLQSWRCSEYHLFLVLTGTENRPYGRLLVLEQMSL